MSFTMLSAALLLAVGAGIFVEAVRGSRHGLLRMAMSLAAVVFSALVAIPLALWLSDTPSAITGEILLVLVPVLETLSEQFPCIDTLLIAAADTLIAPILFLIFFLILRLICRIVIAVLFRKRLAPLPDAPVDPMYESKDAPWHRRHGRLMGGLVGGLCGFLASLLLLSPVIGVFSVADSLLTKTERLNVKWDTLGLSREQVYSMQTTVHDPSAMILEAMGGGLIFDATACTDINGHRIYLRREIDTCMEVMADLVSVVSVISHVDEATQEQRDTLHSLGDNINSSEVTKLISADFLNRAASSWLEGKTFMKMKRPACGELIEPLLNGALQVCAVSTPECVGRDITTLLHIYIIAVDYGLLTDPNYDELAENLGESSVLGMIYDELRRNPCMAHLADELSNMALRIMASAIEWSDFSDEMLDSFMGDLSDALNMVEDMNADYEGRVNAMTEYILYYADQYGVTIPTSLAEMAATAMVDRFGGTGGGLTSEDMHDLFQQFMTGD